MSFIVILMGALYRECLDRWLYHKSQNLLQIIFQSFAEHQLFFVAMANHPFAHYNNTLTPETSHNLHVQPSPVLNSTYSQGVTTDNNHGYVDMNATLNSTNFPSQNPNFPMSGQFWFHQHGSLLGFRRLNHGCPTDFHADYISRSHVAEPRNILNVNFFMGNNSCVYINLFNNNSPSQFGGNYMLTTSSGRGNTLVQNNVNHFSSLSFNRNILQPNQNILEPRTNSFVEKNENPQLRLSDLQYFYASSSRVANHSNAVDISCLRQNVAPQFSLQGQTSFPSQNIHCDDHIISQDNYDLNLLRMQSRYFCREKGNNFLTLPSSTMNQSVDQFRVFASGNGNSNEYDLRPQQVPKTLGTHPTTVNTVTQSVSQVPYQNDDNLNPNTSKSELHLGAVRRQHSTTGRCRSHPYIKYGPYTCPKCNLVVENANSFAAHVKKHYKDETPDERKKRREAKFTSRDLHIAHSTAGLTVMPGSRQMEVTSLLTRQDEGRPSCVKIKEEDTQLE